MRDRLDVGEPPSGAPARLQPLLDCALIMAGCGSVMGKQFRLPLDEISKLILEHRGDASMQFLAASPQQRAVSGVLHQGVFKHVRGLRRCAAAEQESRIGQLAKCDLEIGTPGHRLDQFVAEFTPEHGTNLRHFPSRGADPVQSRNQ